MVKVIEINKRQTNRRKGFIVFQLTRARRYSKFINDLCLWSSRLVNVGIKLIERERDKKIARVT